MSSQPAPSQPAGAGAEYTPEVLQRLVDQAAYFNAFSLPAARQSDIAIRGGNNDGVIGFRVREDLHRFAVTVRPPTAAHGLRASNALGESYGKFEHRWMITPDDFVAAPGREPTPTVFDPSRSQRFVMLDGVCTFGDGHDGFRGFGAGKTFPMNVNGQSHLVAATVGTILEGFGSFKGHEAGTYLHCGSLSAERGFTGNMLLRVVDQRGDLRTTGGQGALRARPFPERDITYLVFRGQAVPDDPVTPRLYPDGRFRGLTVVQGLRLISLSSSAGVGGPQSTARIGENIGKITAHVDFNPQAPGGTNLDPIPFTDVCEFNFTDAQGRDIGGFQADSTEGRVFNIKVAGQGGIRFGGVGQILSGTGPFQGMHGLMTDNSVVIFQPHVSASLYVLRVYDPDCRFRVAVGGH